MGGFVVDENEAVNLSVVWKKIKIAITGSDHIEIKWKDFFIAENPLGLNLNQAAKRGIAAYILKNLFNSSGMLPLVAVIQKDKADSDFLTKSAKGTLKIMEDFFLLGLLGMFAGFLGRKREHGRVIFDTINATADKHRQEIWLNEIRQFDSKNLPDKIVNQLSTTFLIKEEFVFEKSADNELLQIADFFCGLIWTVSEGDENLLGVFHTEFGERAEREGLGLLHNL